MFRGAPILFTKSAKVARILGVLILQNFPNALSTVLFGFHVSVITLFQSALKGTHIGRFPWISTTNDTDYLQSILMPGERIILLTAQNTTLSVSLII